MPIRQADVPNHCSIANKAVYETYMVLAKLTMPFGCSATLRSLSHCLQLIRHSSRQLLCPSCHLIHFVLRSATLHHVRTLSICYKAWHTIQSTKQSTSDAHTFSQPHATILTGFHSAILRPTFISVAFSPPAANNFARLAYHRLRYGATLTQTLAHALSLPQSLEVHGTFRPFTVRPSGAMPLLLSAPAGGARSRLRSALTLTHNLTLHKASLRRL
jgi:hypothetical protein